MAFFKFKKASAPSNGATLSAQPKRYYIPQVQPIDPLCEDILSSPHTLIGGTTGSGKSVLINSIIASFMLNYGVSNRLYLIDPKRVELSIYKNLPHCNRYTSDTNEAIDILDEVLRIVEARYKEMESRGLRQYDGPHIYLIIDELADIMVSPRNKDFKLKLQKILQIARASNVHCICATQSPSRAVIPASLVLNFTNRVALRCLSAIESRQIVNQGGAELLPQYGQGLYLSPKYGMAQVSIPYTEQYKIDHLIYDWIYGCMVARDN